MRKINLILPILLSLIGIVSAGGMIDGFYGGGMMVFGWIFMILIFVALILFIIWMIKQIQKK